MNRTKLRKVIYFIAIMVVFVAAQNHEEEHKDKKDMHSDDTHMKAEEHDHNSHGHGSKKEEKRDIEPSIEKSNFLDGLIDNYVLLKNALVVDDSKKAAFSAELMLKTFNDMDVVTLTDSQKKEYKEIAENSQEQLEHIIKSPIDHQRQHFEVVSNDLNDLITLVGTAKHLFMDFCPMVNKGEGAIWISETEEIKNPYTGSKSKCGEVKKVIN